MATTQVTTAADIRTIPTRRTNEWVLPSGGRRVSWGAVFAGVFCGMAIQLLLTSLGGAIGLTTLDAAGTDAAKGVGIGAGIWLLISMLVSAYAGGWIAARLSANTDRLDSAIHGLASWAVTWLLGAALMLAGAGALLGGLGRLVGGAARMAPEMMSATGTGGAVVDTVRSVGNQIQGAAQNPNNQAAARDTAQNAADKAATGAAVGGWALFGIMLLAGAAATIGGLTAPQRSYPPRPVS